MDVLGRDLSMVNEERKREKAVKKIAVRKAVGKGVGKKVVEDTVEQAIVKAAEKVETKKEAVKTILGKGVSQERVVIKKVPAEVTVAKEASKTMD
jgi:hypothetical protein